MKMFNKRVIALLLTVITVIFVASCTKPVTPISEGITLTEYSTPLEFHTSAQAEYIYGERPLFLDISIDGKAEYPARRQSRSLGKILRLASIIPYTYPKTPT